MAGQTVIVSVLADTRRFDAGLNNASSSLQRFSRSISGITRTIGVTTTIAAVAFGRFVQSAILSAADFEQLVGGVSVVFGDYAKEIEDAATGAFRTAGVATNDYLKTATVLGSVLR